MRRPSLGGRLTEIGKVLHSQIQRGVIEQDVLESCLRGLVLEDRALGYSVVTSWQVRLIRDFVPTSETPMLCLEYLLACIEADRESVNYDDDVHTVGEALLELQVPMSEHWERRNAAIPLNQYWERIEKFLLNSKHYYPDFVTHLLEGTDKSLHFSRRLKFWRADPALARYIDDLSAI